jgi:hypothetical protein
MVKDFEQVGAVSEAEMREFERDCFVPDADQEASEPQKTGLHASIRA